jgi:hypothetical protein
MVDEDVEKIRKILEHRRRQDLAELLSGSTSKIQESGWYSNDYYCSRLSTFEILSPIENYEKLKKLSEEDKKEILNAVLEIHPPKDNSPEIVNLEFYVDVNSKPEAGLHAYCTECGASQGLFTDLGELRRKIAEQKKCVKCSAEFRFLSNGTIWNLEWEIIPSKIEYIIKLLEEIEKEEQQYIFCYEDLGPKSSSYRYPQKRMKFQRYKKTERASPAYVLNIFDKETNKIEKSYCFDSPYALFQIAKEALKGYKWLKYGVEE